MLIRFNGLLLLDGGVKEELVGLLLAVVRSAAQRHRMQRFTVNGAMLLLLLLLLLSLLLLQLIEIGYDRTVRH